MKKIKVTLLKSFVGIKRTHRATVRGLGLKRINHAVELAGEDHLRGQRALRDDARRLQSSQIDVGDRKALQLARAHFGDVFARGRMEAALRQPAMQRHLPALEADFMEAA